MKLGTGTYAYMWSIGFDGARPARPMTAIDLMNRAIELGLKVVQFGPNLALDSLKERDFRDLIGCARAGGVEIEAGTRGIGTDHLVRWIELTRKAGATLLRSVPELEGGVIPSASRMESLLKAVEPVLDANGVRLALENTVIPARTLRSVLETVANPHVGITLDTVNSLAVPEGTREVAETLAPFTLCLHVKDFVVFREWHMMGFRVEGRPAGQGQLDVPWLIRCLEKAGASPNAILELWPPQQASVEETILLEQQWAVDSIRYLRTLIPD